MRVIELGAGKSGLVGLALASIWKREAKFEFEVVLTDGNEKCVQSLQQNVALNPDLASVVSARLLMW